MMDIDWGWLLMEIGAWLISIGLTLGLFLTMLWLGAYLMGGKK